MHAFNNWQCQKTHKQRYLCLRSTFTKGHLSMEQPPNIEQPSTYKPRKRTPNGTGLALGVGVGVAIGVAMNNIGVGIAIGAALGIAFDQINIRRRS
jgi:hypothetical protein